MHTLGASISIHKADSDSDIDIDGALQCSASSALVLSAMHFSAVQGIIVQRSAA